MKVIKKNKFTIIAIVIFIMIVLLGLKAKDLFFPNNGKAVYGHRLDGIEKVDVKNQTFENLKSTMEQEANITKISYDTRGRLINFIITVTDDTTIDHAKTLSNKLLEFFTDEQKQYFDLQVFVKKEAEDQTNFPIIGSKHNQEQGFYWTKDR